MLGWWKGGTPTAARSASAGTWVGRAGGSNASAAIPAAVGVTATPASAKGKEPPPHSIPCALPKFFAEPIESQRVLVIPMSASTSVPPYPGSRSVPMLRIEPPLGSRVCAGTWEGVGELNVNVLGFRRSLVVPSSTSSERPMYATTLSRKE